MTKLSRICLLLAAGGIVLSGAYFAAPDGSGPAPALAQANSVSFPPLDRFVQYTTVERGNVLEHMMTSPETIALIKAGRELPVGTQNVLVDHRDGKLLRYLVAQKVGTGRDDWEYQSFMPDRVSIQTDENPARCYSCHQSRQDRSFMFTYTDAMRFNN